MKTPTQIPSNPDYGSGCFRRRIRIDITDPSHASAGFEDDFHAFTLELMHDGHSIQAIEARSLRYPAAICPDAQSRLQALIGRPLTADRKTFLGYDNVRLHCTHLHDMLWLTMSQVLRGTATRQFDIAIPDERDGQSVAELRINGEPTLLWKIAGGRVLAPDPLAGASLRGGFNEKLRALYTGDTLEGAMVLQMGCLVSNGRRVQLDALGTLVLTPDDWRVGRCFRFQWENLEKRPPSTHQLRDFTATPERLLEWHAPDNATAFDPAS